MKELSITVHPDVVENEEVLLQKLSKKLGVSPNRIRKWKLVRRSIDARKRQPMFVLRFQLWVDEQYEEEENWSMPLQDVQNAAEVFIIGLGPAGLFSALKLIELGYKPIVIERGKGVRQRRRDLAQLTRNGEVNPDSNYCFGEGGAGTFSDGKLYTRSNKRGNTKRILRIFHQFGASENILIDAHPHIGTNKLPQIIQNMREAVLAHGGEVHFDTKLTDIRLEGGNLQAVQLNGDEWVEAKAMVLATGHSARDIFELLHRRKVLIEAKAFALGVRVEHPQSLIDKIQYHQPERHIHLPAASYSLVRQVYDKGVYSFCMCPGGIICPAATENGEIVVNGWSPSKRNSPYANSGIVTEISLGDMKAEENPLAGVAYQRKVEQRAFEAGGGKQVAPAQRLADFVAGKNSSTLPNCSYIPGITPVDLREVLPKMVAKQLRQGFKQFGRMLKGYVTEEAVVVATESRTSSPVRIPRDRESLMHPQVAGLFPSGEGAGYAGGIMSAAIDGEKVAEAIAKWLA